VSLCSNWIDAAIGRVVDDLKTSGLYEDTLICFNADNGGPLPTGNNWPLKGGKFSNCAPHPQAGICQSELSEEARFGSPSFKPSSRAPKASLCLKLGSDSLRFGPTGEGGIRVNAWASGGYLPAKVRGSTVRGLMGGWDWYATWAALAGVEDITDHKAAAAHLPPVVRSLFGPDLNHASLLSVSRVRFGWLGLESCVRQLIRG